MTPILVLLFKIEPLAAVSSDIVASMIMKPIGGGILFKRGSVNTHTTQRYVHATGADLRDAISKLPG